MPLLKGLRLASRDSSFLVLVADVYVLQDSIITAFDAWLAEFFDPEHPDETCARLAAAAEPTGTDEAAITAARRTVADCDARLRRYRSALEQGADAAVIASWISCDGFRRRASSDKKPTSHN